MTQDQLELLNKLYSHDKWVVKRTSDGKSAVVEGRVEIAVADEKHAAELIVQIRNTYTALVEELSKLKAAANIRGGALGAAIEKAVDKAVKDTVAETLGQEQPAFPDKNP